MAGSTLLIVTAFASAFWAAVLLTIRPAQLMAAPQRYSGMRTLMVALVVLFMVASGFAVDRWGLQTVLVLASCMAALAFLAFDRSDSLAAAVGGTALLAGAVAAMAVSSAVLMTLAFFPAHAPRSLNLGFVALFCGILLGQPLVKIMTAKLGQRATLLALALTSLLPAAGAACAVELDADLPVATSSLVQLLSDPRLALQLAMIALCFPLEAALGPWVSRFSRELGHYPGTAALLGIGFWLAFLGARVGAAFMLPAKHGELVLLLMVILAAVTFGNMLGAYARTGSSIGLIATGVCCGALVPTMVGMLLQSQAENAAPAAGLAMAAGMLGTLVVLPWIDSSRPERSSRATIRGAVVVAVLLIVPALVLVILG